MELRLDRWRWIAISLAVGSAALAVGFSWLIRPAGSLHLTDGETIVLDDGESRGTITAHGVEFNEGSSQVSLAMDAAHGSGLRMRGESYDISLAAYGTRGTDFTALSLSERDNAITLRASGEDDHTLARLETGRGHIRLETFEGRSSVHVEAEGGACEIAADPEDVSIGLENQAGTERIVRPE